MSYAYQKFSPLFLGIPFDPTQESRFDKLIELLLPTTEGKRQSASIETYIEEVKKGKFFAANPAYGNLFEYCVSLCEENGILNNNSKVNTAMAKVAAFFLLCFVPEEIDAGLLSDKITVFSGKNVSSDSVICERWDIVDTWESPKTFLDIDPPKHNDVLYGIGSDGIPLFLEKYTVDSRGKRTFSGIPLEELCGIPKEA